jgi:hypothetical protein
MQHTVKLIAATLALCAASNVAHAQSLPLIDDFTTGPLLINLNGESQTRNLLKKTTQTGANILGGTRNTWVYLNLAANPYRQNATFQIKQATANSLAAAIESEGFQTDIVPQLFYGIADGVGTQSLHANLTVYDRIRVTFAGISQGVQFVPEAWSGSNSTLWSCGLGQSLVGETLDIPLVNGGINTGSGANFAAIDGLFFEWENNGYEGNDLAITRIEMEPAGTQPANITCPPYVLPLRK